MIYAILVMLILGAILGIGLGVADKFLKVEADPRTEKVSTMLPNYNCGGCGYAGCSAFAEAMVNKEVNTFLCKPCKADKKQEIIEYLANTPGPDGSTVNIKG
ncbi:(Fe-S)-binding protein [Floccifex sp.]|uniref:(Fe-S)-binding protein n=1 Tax=Floccifex sp. TaxID=2815810 RepID=UPI002A764E2A|nr:(Fe-S)-binding protein [Floccifex sp.]MDD7281142.1 (Fe-S)-binding protein [Erysipelotrichaceae bacterium]MDY2958058.1 (Fe-S)-binding protein [Floccifex sp.]